MYMPKESQLKYLSPEEIERNPENPRMIFDEKKLSELMSSINEIGILVPLIVYYDEKKKKYILLDGERRLRCSRNLNLTKVPVNVIATPNKVENILQMFNIHNVRIEWGPMEVAWKLKILMKELNTEKESELAKLTSLKPMEIRKSKTLLSYDEKYQDLVHKGPKNGGIKEDFLVELKPTLNWVEKELPDIKRGNFINAVVDKHHKGIIGNYVKGFRNLSKLVRSGIQKSKVKSIFDKIINDPSYNLDQAYEASIKYQMDINEIEKRAERLLTLISGFKIKKEDESNRNLLNILKKLRDILDKIL